MDTFHPGQRVVWLVPLAEYGCQLRVPAVVVKVGPSRVQVEASPPSGARVMRWVVAKNLAEDSADPDG